MEEFEIRFLADSMLGRLARWLRVMGYDTHYRPFYKRDEINALISNERRLLLTRSSSVIRGETDSIFLLTDNLKGQLYQLRSNGYLKVDRSRWFSRCLICNTELKKISISRVKEYIPEYIFCNHNSEVSCCPFCRKYFWPGSHRIRMIDQLEKWGFVDG